MRYRSFGNSGMAVSAVSLLLRDEPSRGRGKDQRGLILGALEAGVNCFELAGASPALLAAAGEALAAVDRRLVFVSWRLEGRHGMTAQSLSDQIGELLERTGLSYLDLLMVKEPAETLSQDAIALLKAARQAGLARALGVSGDGDAIDGYIATGAFDALSTTYNLNSGWRERNRLKLASERDMAVICCDAWPRDLREMKIEPLGKRGLFASRANPLKGVGGYHFLDHTHGWTAEEICVAYALTEPAIATVQVEDGELARLQRLAEVPERDLPTGVAAQIEMARFSAGQPGAA